MHAADEGEALDAKKRQHTVTVLGEEFKGAIDSPSKTDPQESLKTVKGPGTELESTVQRTDALMPFEGMTTDRGLNDSMLLDIGKRAGVDSIMRVDGGAEAPFLPMLGSRRVSLKDIKALNQNSVKALASQWQADAVKGQYGKLDPRRKTSQYKVSALDGRKRLPQLAGEMDSLQVQEYLRMLANSPRSLEKRQENGAAYMQVQYLQQNTEAIRQQVKKIERELAISSSRLQGNTRRGSRPPVFI